MTSAAQRVKAAWERRQARDAKLAGLMGSEAARQDRFNLMAGLRALYEGRRSRGVTAKKNWWKTVLANKYTPVVSSALSVIATDAAFVLLATSATPAAPLTLGMAALFWSIGRAAGFLSVMSTGYQYQHNLYGTTLTDFLVAVGTFGISFIPKPDMAVANHIGFLYTVYTTWIR